MDYRLFFPATQRNKKHIGDVLSKIIISKGSILEIGSGSGEHGITFQKRFPDIIWQTSDPELKHRNSIISWIKNEKLDLKMPLPLEINVNLKPWGIPYKVRKSLIGIISINMIHIAEWNCTKALFEESGELLNEGKFLMLYGPFKISRKNTSESNKLFDKSLKLQNPKWGVRNLEEVIEEGIKNGFVKADLIEMPSNNYSIIFRKAS